MLSSVAVSLRRSSESSHPYMAIGWNCVFSISRIPVPAVCRHLGYYCSIHIV